MQGGQSLPSWWYVDLSVHSAVSNQPTVTDIEDTLVELIKKSGGILGRGSKFSKMDVKITYFGNWLRDYSQAMDIAGLSKL